MAESGSGITNALAWWGAVVSTGLGALRVVELLRDRAKVVVSYKTGWRVTPNLFGYDPTKDYIVITVTNRGRRPVTITTVGGITKEKGQQDFVLHDSFTQGSGELAEGKAATYLIEQALVDLGKLKWFVAYDMTDRMYRCNVRARDTKR